jgi:hypothetical protein
MHNYSSNQSSPQRRPLDDFDAATIAISLDLLRLIRAGVVSRFVAHSEALSYACALDDAGLIGLTLDPDAPCEVYMVEGNK